MNYLRGEISVHIYVDTAVHESSTCMSLACLAAEVFLIRIKTLELYAAAAVVGSAEHLNECEHSLALVLCNKHPCVPHIVLKYIADAVLIACADKGIVFLEHLDLCGDLVSVSLGNTCNVQLLAEGSHHSNVAACGERSCSADCVVGAVGNVRTHSGGGVTDRSAVLDLQALDSVCIVRCPDLR